MQRKAEPLPWSPEDDEVLREAVSIHGAKAWSAIACGLPRRSSKECRARWLVLEELDATLPEYKRASAPAAMTAHLQVSSTALPPKPKPKPSAAAAAAASGSARAAADAARPASPQPLISRLPVPSSSSRSSTRAGGTGRRGEHTALKESQMSPSSATRERAQETGRRRASPADGPTAEQSEVLPPPVPNPSQQINDFARKRARLSPQAFLEEALSPHHMSVSSVCSPSVEICDEMTMTGYEQLADDDAGSNAAAAEESLSGSIDTADNGSGPESELEMVLGDDSDDATTGGTPFALTNTIMPPSTTAGTGGGVRPPPLQCIADEYCAADEAFLQPRTPLLLREIDADDISSDPVSASCLLSQIIQRMLSTLSLVLCVPASMQRFSCALQQSRMETCSASPRSAPKLADTSAGGGVGQICHSAEQRLNVSPLATVLQGGRENDSVQRLIHIAQNLSLQPPDSPLESPSAHLSAQASGVRGASILDKSNSLEATTCTSPRRQQGHAEEQQQQQQEIDWKDRERGFLHRQLLHNLFFRHSCSAVAGDAAHAIPPVES